MKKLSTLIIFSLVITFGVFAQEPMAQPNSGGEFKKFKFGIGLGYAIPSDGGAGVLFYLEPMYRVADNFTIGLRWESAALGATPTVGSLVTVEVSALTSFSANFQYYFSNENFRPFIGAGLGMYSIAAPTSIVTGGGLALSASTDLFGFYPRIGFDAGHFNMSLDYNILPAQETITSLGGFGFATSTTNSSYIGFRLGVAIGGGRKPAATRVEPTENFLK